MTRALRLLAILLTMAAPAAAQRLPGTVVPEHYTLAFEPDLAKETFRGHEAIRVTLTEPATSITLHAAEITFGEVTHVGRAHGSRVTTDAKGARPLAVPSEGQATQTVNRRARRPARGFYISKANGRSAVSQMEATDRAARFPPSTSRLQGDLRHLDDRPRQRHRDLQRQGHQRRPARPARTP
jgi:hypothetical protein